MAERQTQKRDMSTTRDNFGTFTPAERPPAEILLNPLKGPGCVGKIYCQHCGMMFEFRTDQLAPLVSINNCFSKKPFDARQFDAQKHFFVAKGCLACAEEPIFLICDI